MSDHCNTCAHDDKHNSDMDELKDQLTEGDIRFAKIESSLNVIKAGQDDFKLTQNVMLDLMSQGKGMFTLLRWIAAIGVAGATILAVFNIDISIKP